MSLPFSLDNAALVMMSGCCIITSAYLSVCKQRLLLPVHFFICIPLRVIIIMKIWIRDVFFGALDAPHPSMYTPLWSAIYIYITQL